MAYQDLTGLTFGEWTVLSDAHETTSDRDHYWNCQCSCGTQRKVRGSSLKKGTSKSCGCLARKKLSERSSAKLLGQRFGKLVVIEQLPSQNGHVMWKCKCDCGNKCIRSTTSLNASKEKGNIASCGCIFSEIAIQKGEEKMVGKKFGKLTVLEATNERKWNRIVWKCQCDCGNICYIETNSLTSGNTTSCGCINYSIGEKNIENIFKENNILFKSQFTLPELKLKKYDFVILNEQNQPIRLIEFDGRQHFDDVNGIWNSSESLEDIQSRDKIKNQWALEHNIPLVRIPYWERDNITLEMLMGKKYLITEDTI